MNSELSCADDVTDAIPLSKEERKLPKNLWRRRILYELLEVKHWWNGDTRPLVEKFKQRCQIVWGINPDIVSVFVTETNPETE